MAKENEALRKEKREFAKQQAFLQVAFYLSLSLVPSLSLSLSLFLSLSLSHSLSQSAKSQATGLLGGRYSQKTIMASFYMIH